MAARPCVLFTGYAPVHFACFKPLFDALVADGAVDVLLSGGLRTKRADDTLAHDGHGLYGPFGVPDECVLDVEQIADLDVDILVTASTSRVEPRSFKRSIQIFHGVSFRNRSLRAENTTCDRYLLIGPYMRRMIDSLGLFAGAAHRLVPIGFPKTDRLLDGSLDRAQILAEFGFTGERPVVLYAPTGARHNSLETIGDQLVRALASSDWDVLVKPHDHPKEAIDWYARLAPHETPHLRLVRSPDVIPLLFAADLLITDASSVANEFALLDRPIVYVDVPELLAAAAAEDSRLDLKTWGRKGGAVTRSIPEALNAITAGLRFPHRRSVVRRRIASDLFYNPGTATETAVRWLGRELAQL